MGRYLLLGLIQGLTEFLPVSSSAHLVFARVLLGVDPPGTVLAGALHLGTMLAVLLCFRREFLGLARGVLAGDRESYRYLFLLAVGTVPVAVAGLLFRAQVERAFADVRLAGGLLFLTGAALLVAERALRAGREGRLGPLKAAGVGIAQAAALLPGISRSGATISAGIVLGLGAREAARFSFMLAVPAILGAGLVSLGSPQAPPGREEVWGMLLGGLVAFGTGTLAIRFLLSLLFRGRLGPFAVYCFAVGAAALALG